MKLYTFDTAPNPARLKMFIDYKKLTIDTEQVDMATRAHQNPEYIAVVPDATLPALVLEDGTVLTEVIAIAHYLEALFPERPLLGTTPLERALVLNWNHKLFNTGFMAAAEVFRNSHPAFVDRALPGLTAFAQLPQLVERGQARLTLHFETMNKHLADHTFICGESFSFADIDMLAILVFAGWGARMRPDTSLQHLHAWRARAEEALAG
jgi:glutathione S-transferase